MAHPLDGPRLKIRRAQHEINALIDRQHALQVESNYEAVCAELNPKTGKQVYRLGADVIVDPKWGVWIGEISHNLRSALDGLV
jgi:hypothetical protein